MPHVRQGVPSVARAAAVTGIHDPTLLEVGGAGLHAGAPAICP